VPHSAKFGGATGQFNAHAVAFPSVDWVAFADQYECAKKVYTIDYFGLTQSIACAGL
jgi:hypothetical protein